MTDPIILTMSGISNTVGTVAAYNDGTINVPTININNRQAVLTACREILAAVGKAGRPYKLQVVKNGAVIVRIRSVWWGSRLTTDGDAADWVLIDYPNLVGVLS